MIRDQYYRARTIIPYIPHRPDIVATLTGLTIDEVKKEKERLEAAWEMVLYGRGGDDVVKDTGINEEEVDTMQVVRDERSRCIFNALDYGLTREMVRAIWVIDEKEMDYWWRKWKIGDDGEMNEMKRVEDENDRISNAWGMVLADFPDDEILECGISLEELVELKIIQQERRRLFFTAFDNDLTPDMIQSFFGLSDAEMEVWWLEWMIKEGRVGEIL